jgi:ABC-type transport system involved in multi-copper enzyme maturation permease subunit
MLGIPQYLYRLLPANPILLRVISSSSKRLRDLFIRCIYLGLLIVIVLISIGQGRSGGAGDLAALSRTSSQIFEQLSYLQLLLVAMLAPVFTAAAITQEKDSQTYDILLSTPLSNGQIVLGSLMSRLFFIFALLLSGIPIFSITQLFGGVAIGDIVLSVLIAAATAMVTGALAIAIATFKVGTRRTIFSFYLFNVIYLVGLAFLSRLDFFRLTLVDGSLSKTNWLTALHPFLALYSVLDPVQYAAPTASQLPASVSWWPLRTLWTNPAGFYIGAQFTLSVLLIMPSILLLRRMAQSTTTIQQSLRKLLPFRSVEQARKPRLVWSNPIAWREARTKASAARSVVLRLGFIGLGLLAAVGILIASLIPGETPTKRLGRNAYNAAAGTILIQGDPIGTYAVNDQTVLNIDGTPAPLRSLGQEYAFVSFRLTTLSNGTKMIQTLDVRPVRQWLDTAVARRALLGIVLLEMTAILLIVTNAAASTVTREKEDGTLDLLLSTPITSRYYIWGKIRGLVSYVLPLVAVPVVSCLIFVVADIVRSPFGTNPWFVLPEAVFILPVMLVVVVALASLIGMHMSLRCRTTVMAVMSSIGIVLGVCGFLGFCSYQLLRSNSPNEFLIGLAGFSPATLTALLIAPTEVIFDRQSSFRPNVVVASELTSSARVVLLMFSIFATAIYAAVVWWMYRSMVKNFDMTIRKQSR